MVAAISICLSLFLTFSPSQTNVKQGSVEFEIGHVRFRYRLPDAQELAPNSRESADEFTITNEMIENARSQIDSILELVDEIQLAIGDELGGERRFIELKSVSIEKIQGIKVFVVTWNVSYGISGMLYPFEMGVVMLPNGTQVEPEFSLVTVVDIGSEVFGTVARTRFFEAETAMVRILSGEETDESKYLNLEANTDRLKAAILAGSNKLSQSRFEFKQVVDLKFRNFQDVRILKGLQHVGIETLEFEFFISNQPAVCRDTNKFYDLE